jgi:diacylglycerol O-acyltransferase / wax synthase
MDREMIDRLARPGRLRLPDRLSALDVSFLYLEESATPMHVGAVSIFATDDEGLGYDRLVSIVAARIGLVPRYRQRVRGVPGRIAGPVWVDAEDFDLGYHVRLSAIPKPGTDAQLFELAARVISRPLDTQRPLWELYLVEGLSGGRVAMVSKTHLAMVDGTSSVDLGQVILDSAPSSSAPDEPEPWSPAREPSSIDLVQNALGELTRTPGALVDKARSGLGDVRRTVTGLKDAAAGVLSVVHRASRPPSGSPLTAATGQQRRFATAAGALEDYKRVRKAHGGTVNDVVLAVVAGGLRDWLMTRGEAVGGSASVRALVPISVRGSAGADGFIGTEDSGGVRPFLIDLPVGEPNAVIRLHQISYAMQAHAEAGHAVAADALIGVAGFAPPTLHSLGARVGGGLSSRVFNLLVTNVPGPQVPLYVGSARLLESYPVMPLAPGQAVSIGVTSYEGSVFIGLNADRDAVPDVDVLADCLTDSLAALLETAR